MIMVTMAVREQTEMAGEVHCLNCGRVLAEAVRDQTLGSMQLRPAPNQSDVQVIVAGRRLLRCGRCGGRAFVELLEEPAEERRSLQGAVARIA